MKVTTAAYTLYTLFALRHGHCAGESELGGNLQGSRGHSGAVLDLVNPDSSLFRSYDLHIDGVLEKLVFPDDNAVSKLVGGGLDVLDLQPDESVEFVKAYSKGGEPGVVLVGLKTSSNKFQKCFELENGAWVSSCSFDGSLKKLKEAAKEQLSFAIQLEDKQGNANCSVTEVMIANLQTRFFSPQCGFYATEVKDGENSVWKAEAGQKCGFVHLFSRGDSALLTMGILGSSNAEHHCYEKVGGEWKEIDLNEFRQRSLEMDRAVQ